MCFNCNEPSSVHAPLHNLHASYASHITLAFLSYVFINTKYCVPDILETYC